jgi:2-dehydropantoate 2-reductase
MGSVFGAHLARAGHDVALIDVWDAAIAAINRDGVRIEDKSGETWVAPARATRNPAEVGPVDLVLVFVKCYHTEAAVRSAAPLLGAHTSVLSLQNGWGNAPRIAAIVGQERVLVGVTYHSAGPIGPGHALHSGRGMTFVGELGGTLSERLHMITGLLASAGMDVTPSATVLREVWSKLALNVCTLPTAALLGFHAPELIQHSTALRLMEALLREVVAVARAQQIELDYDERWQAITGLLERLAPTAKGSMTQDVERRRRTEIDVINGAIVDAGLRLGISTPYNDTMVWMIKALEGTFEQA